MTRAWFYSFVLGLLGIAGGSMLTHTALHMEPVSEKLVITGVVIAVFGGLLINPTPGKDSPLLAVFKSVVIVVAPIVPWSKVAQQARKTAETPVIKPDEELK